MEMKIKQTKIVNEEISLKVTKTLERLPIWIKPNWICPICNWNFNESESHELIAIIQFENGSIEYVHQNCLK